MGMSIPFTPIEGAFTPVLFGGGTAGAPTYVSRAGRYARVGQLVTIHAQVNISDLGGAVGGMRISGLPFPAAVDSNLMVHIPLVRWTGLTLPAPYQTPVAQIQPNASTLILIANRLEGGGAANIVDTHLAASSFLTLVGQYFTDAV